MQQVEIKEWRNGLLREILLTVPQEGAWEEAAARIDAKLEETKNDASLRGAQVTIEFGNRSLSYDELTALTERLRNDFGMLAVAVVSTEQTTIEAARRAAINTYLMLPGTGRMPVVETGSGSNALYVPHTVRSGQRIVHGGHLIIGGDVNAGAEVVAAGDIVIFGTLRGLAHAGSQGDENARILVGNMRPQQIRIAGKIARAPEEAAPGASGARLPEVAHIENGEIQVSLG